MKCTSFVVLAVVAISAVQAAGSLRALLSGPESVGFSVLNQVASFNGIHAGEQILQAVNDAYPDDAKVNGDLLYSVAKRLSSNDTTLATADAGTQGIVAAIHKAFEKLFPGEAFDTALSRVISTIPEPKAQRSD